MTDGSPGNGHIPQQGPNDLFEFPDAEKTGVIVYGPGKHALDASVDPFDGISVQNAQKYFIFGNPAGLFDGLSGIFDEF